MKVDGLDVAKLKPFPIDFRKLSGAMSRDVAGKTKFNTLNL